MLPDGAQVREQAPGPGREGASLKQLRLIQALDAFALGAGVLAATGLVAGNIFALVGAVVASTAAGRAADPEGTRSSARRESLAATALCWALLVGAFRFGSSSTTAIIAGQSVLGPAVSAGSALGAAASSAAVLAGSIAAAIWVSAAASRGPRAALSRTALAAVGLTSTALVPVAYLGALGGSRLFALATIVALAALVAMAIEGLNRLLRRSPERAAIWAAGGAMAMAGACCLASGI